MCNEITIPGKYTNNTLFVEEVQSHQFLVITAFNNSVHVI